MFNIKIGSFGVDIISGLAMEGDCRVSLSALNSDYTIEIRDSNGLVISTTGTRTPGTGPTGETATMLPSSSSLSSITYVRTYLVFSNYVSGSVTLEACRLDPIEP